MTRVADTSALYALLSKDDAHHEEAVAAVEIPEPIVVPSEILAETIDLIAYRTNHDVAQAALEDLLSLPHLTVGEEPVHIEPVRELFEAAGGALSLVDAFVVQTCRVLGATPLAFDRTITQHVG